MAVNLILLAVIAVIVWKFTEDEEWEDFKRWQRRNRDGGGYE